MIPSDPKVLAGTLKLTLWQRIKLYVWWRWQGRKVYLEECENEVEKESLHQIL